LRNFDEDKRICDAATGGPWIVRSSYYGGMNYDVQSKVFSLRLYREENARFIAEAREGWPAALAEIERLQTRVKELCESNAYYIDANERLEDVLYELLRDHNCALSTRELIEERTDVRATQIRRQRT
jgi:hypothetical protein